MLGLQPDERVADRGADDVVAAAGQLDHPIAGVVDIVDVVASLALQQVGPGPTVKRVLAGVARQRVPAGVARGVDIRRAEKRHVLDVAQAGDAEAEGGADEVGAATRQFDHAVADIVDIITIVAAAALHRIRARAAVHDVCDGVPGDDVAKRIARRVRGDARQDKVLDVGAQGEAHRALDRIGSLARVLGDGASRSDDIDVVARAAEHPSTSERVIPAQAIERLSAPSEHDIAELVAGPRLRARPRQREILDVCTQRESGTRADHLVAALARRLDHLVS